MFVAFNVNVSETANIHVHNIIQAVINRLYISKHGYVLHIADVCESNEDSVTLVIWGSEVLEDIKLIWSEDRPNKFDIYMLNAGGYSLSEREYDDDDVIDWITSLVRC